FLAAVGRAARIDVGGFAAAELALVAGLAAVNIGDAFRVRRQRANDGVILLVWLKRHGRHDQDHVRIDRSGLVRLGAADNDAVWAPLDDAQVHVLVLLLGRALAAVALYVGHGAVDDPVVLLHGDGKFPEARVVAGAELLVHVEGG